MKNLFHNNYAMAVISIILILVIVVISLNSNPQPKNTVGQAYINNVQENINSVQKDVIKVEKSPAMIKVYVETKPERYAYLRED